MRGKAAVDCIRSCIWRITPAYAGKRVRKDDRKIMERDHPRVCGEKETGLIQSQTPEGSPPRMRGKGIRLVVLFATLRITPAYAGKSDHSGHQHRQF